jgi:hypothetical protein
MGRPCVCKVKFRLRTSGLGFHVGFHNIAMETHHLWQFNRLPAVAMLDYDHFFRQTHVGLADMLILLNLMCQRFFRG